MPTQWGKLSIRRHDEPLEKTEITWQFRTRSKPWFPFRLLLHNEPGFEYVLSVDQKWAKFTFEQTTVIIPNDHKAIGFLKGMLKLLQAAHEVVGLEAVLLAQGEEQKKRDAEMEAIREQMQRQIAGEMEARIIHQQEFTQDTLPDRDKMSGKFFRECTFKDIVFTDVVGVTFLKCTFDGCDIDKASEDAGNVFYECAYLNEPAPKAVETPDPEAARIKRNDEAYRMGCDPAAGDEDPIGEVDKE